LENISIHLHISSYIFILQSFSFNFLFSGLFQSAAGNKEMLVGRSRPISFHIFLSLPLRRVPAVSLHGTQRAIIRISQTISKIEYVSYLPSNANEEHQQKAHQRGVDLGVKSGFGGCRIRASKSRSFGKAVFRGYARGFGGGGVIQRGFEGFQSENVFGGRSSIEEH
jgi:hypothetical protein